MTPPETTGYGRRIAAARDYAGLSRQQLADQLDMSENTIGRYERDQYEPRLATRQAIARACGVPDWFIEAGFQPAQRDMIVYRAARR